MQRRSAQRLPCVSLLILLLPWPVAALAEDGYLEALIQQSRALELAKDPYWRRLVYYVPAGNDSGWRSEVEGGDFFHSPNGREDPAAELEATLRAFFNPAITEQDAEAGRQHPQCAFVARYHWLRERLGIDDSRLDPQPCERFAEWFAAIDPAQVALVFAADYVGNPSSAFGHTLLRLDRPSENASRLISYAVNYAAVAGDDNPLSYAYKGLSGAYPGYFSLLPYYEKVKEYNDLESRDLWEYELNLTPVEIRRMMMHLWEVGSVSFDYYFLHQNCSYRLLGLLEVARPGLRLTEDFQIWAIPTDTVRVVLEQEDMLRGVTYRPSAERRLKHSRQLASPAVREAALSLADGHSVDHELSAPEAGHALELAHDYLHYHYLDGTIPRDAAAPRMHELLVERSRIGIQISVADPPVPPVRPDQGHSTARAGLGLGYSDGEYFSELQIRTAYHDLADPLPGYRPGTQIDFLGGSLRYELDRDRWQLERFDVAEIWSLAPRNDYLKPVSWKVGGGLMRDPLLDGQRPLVGEFHGGSGFAYALDRQETAIAYGLFEGRLIGSDHIEDRLRLGIGPRLGLVYGGRYGSTHASVVVREPLGEAGTRSEARLEQSLSLHRAVALRLRLFYAEEEGRYYRESTMLLHWYFQGW